MKLTRRRLVLSGAVVLTVAWFGYLTTLVATEPDPGADSAEQLRGRLAAALNQRDAAGLADLLDYPQADRDGFARSYVEDLGAAGVHDVRVSLRGDLAVVEAELADGAPFTYALALQEKDGRWMAGFSPPVP
ncbi:hypothetical protein [Amycolatopsis albispora]|uniref:DUF4878 domain-containing protein n=1 Tax=Amycolatopsis albispora TaxID=1804986 RepID=A0A344LGH4_9PSEU|nr:hypothetical protein [Amycolatopsis albispora]AXB47148.1 hypothetical protein A4R43_35760 [Amycolatopsis albispora]